MNVILDSTAAGNFSQIAYTGTASLAGKPTLQIFAGGNLNLNDVYFTIVNTTGGTLTGMFGNGPTTITAANNPFYVFSVSYANNDVTLTVTQIPSPVPTSSMSSGNTVNFYSLWRA